ncbi:Retrovirus-related Pol polyprotein from transposon RE1 [Glycine soja]|uniref:Retrovirus-related Pol polyprotein from transposon RE1 n=1 Tax=Glycine soja TaxID=3848 RepID=A0A445KL21_GLYSO|nr:Retrovirus-related Pol polyprotein from transposon RE1 [Glycine soja]
MFVKHSSEGKIAVLIVYVDDIVITGDDYREINNLKASLAGEFEIKDLGSLKYFLGMEVARSKKGIVESQQKYILDLLKETGMMGCRPANTPIDPNQKLRSEDKGDPVDTTRYQRLVGRLIYLSYTRPNIAFVVSLVSQFMQSPHEEHLEAVHRILRYLKSTPGRGLFFKKTGQQAIEVFTDAVWAGSITDRKSTSGYCTFVWGNLVTWRSKKQDVVARTCAKVEYRAMAQVVCEILWLKRILEELQLLMTLLMKLYCDNKAAISISRNPVQHDRTKHVAIDRHFIKEKVDAGLICMPFVPSSQQVADILTKGLFRPNFEFLLHDLNILINKKLSTRIFKLGNWVKIKLCKSDKSSSFPFSTHKGQAPEFSSDHSESNVVTALQYNADPNSLVDPGLVTWNQHSKDKLKNVSSSSENTNGCTEDSSLSSDKSAPSLSGSTKVVSDSSNTYSTAVERVVVYSRKTNVEIEDGGTILPISDDRWVAYSYSH